MTLIQHLEELRGRILRSLAALADRVLASASSSPSRSSASCSGRSSRYLPQGKKLVFLKVTDPFVLYMKVAALAGLFLVLPYMLYQVWRFIAPGPLPPREALLGPVHRSSARSSSSPAACSPTTWRFPTPSSS